MNESYDNERVVKRRAARGEGTIYFRSSDQRWVGAVVKNGHRWQVYGPTETEARNRLREKMEHMTRFPEMYTKRAIASKHRPKQDRKLEGFVYFLRCPLTGAIKIGFSVTLQKRLLNMAAGLPYDVELIGKMAGTIFEEKALQRRFKKFNIRREWFEPAPELMRYIQSYSGVPFAEQPGQLR